MGNLDGGATDGGTDAGTMPRTDAGRDSGVPDSGMMMNNGGPVVGGCPLFPPTHPFNRDISNDALHPDSATFITNLNARAPTIRKPNGNGNEYFNIVPASQAMVAFDTTHQQWFDANGAFQESFVAGQAPVPADVVYENMTPGTEGDHHMMIVQQGTCRLYEMYSWNPAGPTTGWTLLQTWDLNKYEQIPEGKGATTAAGTPIMPGVVWKHEVDTGEIKHALQIVMGSAALARYQRVLPAGRAAGACGSIYPLDGFPYGGRLRLKANFDPAARGITGQTSLVVIKALKKYGLFNTDDSGYQDQADFRFGGGTVWDKADVEQLGLLKWTDFEVPQMQVLDSMACN